MEEDCAITLQKHQKNLKIEDASMEKNESFIDKCFLEVGMKKITEQMKEEIIIELKDFCSLQINTVINHIN